MASILSRPRVLRMLVILTHEHMETDGCVVSTVVTEGLVLKHQAIRNHRTE